MRIVRYITKKLQSLPGLPEAAGRYVLQECIKYRNYIMLSPVGKREIKSVAVSDFVHPFCLTGSFSFTIRNARGLVELMAARTAETADGNPPCSLSEIRNQYLLNINKKILEYV